MDFLARVGINLKLVTNLKSAISNSLEFINILVRDGQYADDDSLFCLPVSLPAVSPVSIVMDMEPIKNKLPVVTFGHFQDNCKQLSSSSSAAAAAAKKCDLEEEEVCAICLNHMECSHEMRELPNCCHVFHRDCLDSWMDQHQITCPTCRSTLLLSTQHTDS